MQVISFAADGDPKVLNTMMLVNGLFAFPTQSTTNLCNCEMKNQLEKCKNLKGFIRKNVQMPFVFQDTSTVHIGAK